ncbi:TPA: autotransporter outer membrane beta-barrel domain-containing protein [Citrobacter freundii]|uniref:autotransporter outer membrane beta-barrel domain-containing protein n=1 Tax=Citrobacter freundii TaxID=546 RepID=UPI00383B0EE9|nr:autotransporter outer membrane beta-barrel domain-containing protein [Citrobacter freundii]
MKSKKLNPILLAILSAVTVTGSPHVYATSYSETVNTKDTEIVSGDYILVNDSHSDPYGEPVGIYATDDNPINVGDDGQISVNVISEKDAPRGIGINNTQGNNLGDGTSIHVIGKANSDDATIGINIVNNSSLKASHLDIYARGVEQVIGIASSGSNNDIDLGEGSSIDVGADGTASGLYLQNASLKADALNIHAEGAFANGLTVFSDDGRNIDLGSKSQIVINTVDGGSDIFLSDSNNDTLTADHLRLAAFGNNTRGIKVSKTGNNSTVDLGVESVITTEGENSIGILYGEDTKRHQADLSNSGSGDNKLTADHLKVYTKGKNSRGISINKTGGNSVLDLGTGSYIYVDGENSVGILYGEDAQGTLTASNLEVLAHGKGSSGVELHNGNVNLDGSYIKSTDSSGVILASRASGESPDFVYNDGLIWADLDGLDASGAGAKAHLNDATVISNKSYALKADLDGSIESNNLTAEGITALYANTGGDINFSGHSIIVSDQENAIVSENKGSSVSGTGSAIILGNIIASKSGSINLNLDNNSIFDGTANQDQSSAIDIALSEGSTWRSTGSSFINTLTLNNSSLIIGDPTATNNTVTINGDFTAQNGHIFFNSVLGDDSSPSEKLIINGNSSGESLVTVNNLGGKGDKTVNGIEIIHIDGKSDGNFLQDGRIVAGAYDYYLVKNGNNWYLRNLPPESMPGIDPADPTNPTPVPPGNEHINRPEAGSYIENIAAANTMFINRLHDRLGETQYIDALTGEKKVTSMWLRQVGRHNNWRDASGQLKTQSNSYVTQMGGDVAQWSADGQDRWHLGLMAGYGNNHNNTNSRLSKYSSKGSVNGYSVGGYATWYANDETHQGAYLDTWAQYSWFNNSVKGEGVQGESYKSKGVTGSLELGYTHELGEFAGSKGTLNEWFIQPQAQAIWMGVAADDHRESNGTRVSGEGDGNVQTRLGVRTFLKSHSAIDTGKSREFQPFVEVNWLHNTRSFGTKMDGVSMKQAGARNLGELKTGIEGQINPQLNLWGNVGVQVGDKGYNDTSAMIGIKYNFK